jgi:hypothetical protein
MKPRSPCYSALFVVAVLVRLTRLPSFAGNSSIRMAQKRRAAALRLI